MTTTTRDKGLIDGRRVFSEVTFRFGTVVGYVARKGCDRVVIRWDNDRTTTVSTRIVETYDGWLGRASG